MVESNLIGHYVEHAHYSSNVACLIASIADLLALVQPQRTCSTVGHSELAVNEHDKVLKTKREVRTVISPVGYYL